MQLDIHTFFVDHRLAIILQVPTTCAVSIASSPVWRQVQFP